MSKMVPFHEGAVVAGYRLVHTIGAGGMAELWKAQSLSNGALVVVKRPVGSMATRPEGHAMLLDEARYSGSLDHPNIARTFAVIDIGGGVPALVMEYVGGPTLRKVLDRMAERQMVPEVEVALTVIARVCAGLDHAHMARDEAGEPLHIVHRDVTPSNILLRHDGVVKLIDFGIVMAERRRTVTTAGFIKGNPYYMAPEQARGATVDGRTDVYSAGAVLYELLTGLRPYHGLTSAEVLVKLATGVAPAAPSQVDASIARDVEALVVQSMHPSPDLRFSSAAALRYAVEETMRRGPVEDRVLAEMVQYLFPEGAEPSPMLGAATPAVAAGAPLPVKLVPEPAAGGLRGLFRALKDRR